jgi:flagellin-like hook-associated protein FlgL
MPRIATFALHKFSLAQTLETQRHLTNTQIQVGSGKVARDYGGVALEVSDIGGFAKNIDIVDSRLKLMETSVAGTFDIASRLRNLLVNALNIDNASLLTLNQRAKDMIIELAGQLNTSIDGRHLFAGARIGSEPIDTSTLLSDTVPLVDAKQFTGGATSSGTGILSINGITRVQVETGNTNDAFQLTYSSGTQTFALTNLAGGTSATLPLNGLPAAGTTKDLTFSVGGEKVVVSINEFFATGTDMTTAAVSGNVGAGVGAFGPVSVLGTTGDVSKISGNTFETSGTAAAATLTLASTDGNFTATAVDLTTPGTQTVLLTNGITKATFRLSVNVAVGLNDAAIASADTEIRLGNFLRNVAATDGSVNTAQARPGDPGYDATKPPFYKGDSTVLSARIDFNATVDYGITGDQPGFEKLFRALFMVRTANVTPGNIDRATLDSALGLVIEAMDEIPDIRSQVGSDLLAAANMKSRHDEFLLFTQEAISGIEDVDIAAAVARIGIEQTQLEASYMLTARLSQLTIANFLR